MPAPTGAKLEFQFTAGVWTDVTSDLYGSSSIAVGRGSPWSTTQPSTFTFTLTNTDGRYTPNLQILRDGVTAAPYYPNVKASKLVRFSLSTGVRYVGEIRGFTPVIVDGKPTHMQIDCVDVTDRLSRVQLAGPIRQELLIDGPVRYWPMTDTGSLAMCVDQGPGATRATALRPYVSPNNKGQTSFAVEGPPSGDGGALGTAWVGPGTTSPFMIANQVNVTTSAGFSVEMWVRFTLPLPSWVAADWEEILYYESSDHVLNGQWLVDPTGTVNIEGAAFPLISTPGAPYLYDGFWHHIVVTTAANGTQKLYVDKVLAATLASNLVVGQQITRMQVAGPMSGSTAHLAVYTSELSAARIAVHYNAGVGWAGETVDQRILRLLGYAGFAAGDCDLDVSTVLLNSYPQAGKDIATACQDAAETEGGGAVFYVKSGRPRFRNRHFRSPTVAPTLTIDSGADTDGSNYQPTLDRSTLVNQASVDNADVAGTISTYTYTDPNLDPDEGIYSGQSLTSYSQDPNDAPHLAQEEVAANREPATRLPKLAVDLFNATNNLYAAVQATEIGSRVRETNLPNTLSSVSTRDSIVEGWSETFTEADYQVVFDCTPADNPARAILNDTSYGRLQCKGQTTHGARTAAQTTMQFDTAAGLPLFTTNAGAYPMYVKVAEEIIQLTQAPTGTAPQSFANCLRGQLGTTAAAQVAGQEVQLCPHAALSI